MSNDFNKEKKEQDSDGWDSGSLEPIVRAKPEDILKAIDDATSINKDNLDLIAEEFKDKSADRTDNEPGFDDGWISGKLEPIVRKR